MRTKPVAIATAVLAPIAVSALLASFRSQVHAGNASLALVVVVLVVALSSGRTPGLVAAISSALCFDFFFTRPYNSLAIATRDDIETTIVLLVVGLTVGELVARSRRFESDARAGRAAASYLRTSAALVAAGESPGQLIHAVERELVVLLDAASVTFEPPPLPGALPALRLGRVTVPDREAAFPFGAPDRNLAEIRAFGDGKLQGRFVVELSNDGSGVRVDTERRAQAIALVDQLGGALAALHRSGDA